MDALFQMFLSVCSEVAIIGAAAVYIYKLLTNIRKPDKDRDDMIRIHSEKLDNDHRRLKELEESNKVIMHSLLAIMSHELDGNHTTELQKAHDELKEYLINR
jgi:hypothetical protein